jgi:prolyl 3-hydroxylase /prolyl 3,4-dihydroxylase
MTKVSKKLEYLISNWLHPKYCSHKSIAQHKKKFNTQKPFPHLELKDFFTEKKILELVKALSQEQFYKKESDLFKLSQTQDVKGMHNTVLAGFRNFLRSKEFITFMESLTGLQLKSGVLDLNASLYQDTDFLLCHDDELEGRKIAFLLYLSHLKKEDGGSLNLFASHNKKPTKIAKRIIPKVNTFAFFEVSPESFHEVSEVLSDKQRIALGGWFHGRK